MNNIISSYNPAPFLDQWQTLIGAAPGPFLAVTFSVIGFLIKSMIDHKRERKEQLRRIEIGITRSLNDMYVLQKQLKQFVVILRNLASEARNITNEREFFLNRTNFPTTREIYRDTDAPTFKVRSYYLHNKILFVDAGIKDLNETVRGPKNGFESLIRQNEFLVALKDNPQSQRASYADNLESFAKTIDDYIAQYIQPGIRIMTQVKVYNNQLRQSRWGITLWRKEGFSFKCFRNKAEQKKYARNLDSMDRIDSLIEKEVAGELEEAEERLNKNSKN